MPKLTRFKNFQGIQGIFLSGLITLLITSSLSREAYSSDSTLPRYREFTIENATALNKLRQELTAEEMTLVLKINRRDASHLQSGLKLVIPEDFQDPDRYSPFPLQLPRLSEIPKIIFVSRRVQAFAAYENGVLVRWGPTSTGRKEQATPATLYHATWKSRLRRSSINRSWLMPWYVNIHTSMGVGLHQYAMPGYPASYGCIRLLKDDAYWVFHWTDQWESRNGRTAESFGTPVIVFGDYDYDQPPPWTHLAEFPEAASVSKQELEGLLDRYLWVLLERNGKSGQKSDHELSGSD